ncbi:MAG: serine hydrolase [Deltaproteobacteria bacterium]|nr:serine hydrolase [Deltaproteobacteria bacterium]
MAQKGLDEAAKVAATLNALRLGEAFDAVSDDESGESTGATQMLDPKQHQELMALRAHQSKKLSRLDKHIVVMFTDLVGSTQYYERYGDLKGREKVLTHNAILFPIVQQNQGVIVKTIGDAIMCYFETVGASLKAAARMQQALAAYNDTVQGADDRIHIRIALNAGVAIAQAGDIYGDVVNVAARIEHQAQADEILMSSSVADDGKKLFPIEAAGSATFKGKAEPVALFRLRWKEVLGEKQKSASLPDRFDVRELLTRGSHGELFLVEDRRSRRVVVVKRLYDFLAEDPDARAAFVNAAKEQQRLEMDGVVRIYDHAEDGELPAFYEAEMIDGASLTRFVSRKGPPKPHEAVAIILRVCAILAGTHQTGTLHGNLEPDNVLVRTGGKLCLTNFGMGSITASRVRRGNSPPGSLAFIAPELVLGKSATVACDVYSLGALTYFLLSGREPIEDATSLQGTIVAAQGAIVPLASVCPEAPPQLASVVNRALSLSPKARPADVKAFAQDVQRALGTVNHALPLYLKEAPKQDAPKHEPMRAEPAKPAPPKPAPAKVVAPEEPPPASFGQVPLDIGEETIRANLPAPVPSWLKGPRLFVLMILLLSFGLGLGILIAPQPELAADRIILPLPKEHVAPAPELKPVPHPLAARLEAAGVIRHGDAFVVVDQGAAIVEWYKDEVSNPIDLGRIGTTVTAFAIGRLIDTAKIRSLSDPLSTWFPEWQQGKKRQVTLRQLLEHSTGLSAPQPDDPLRPANVIRFALAADVIDAPGAKRAFNPKAFNLLAGVVLAASGKKLDRYLADEVMGPLGLRQLGWTFDAEQNPIAAGGVSWHALDLARLGLAFVDGGRRVESQQPLFGTAWREAASAPIVADPTATLLWQLKGGDKPETQVLYAGDPRGSFWLVLPQKRLAAVRLSRVTPSDPKAASAALIPLLLGGEPASMPAVRAASSQPAATSATSPVAKTAAPSTMPVK